MSKNLCAVCNGIFTGLLVEGFDRRMPHHPSVAALKRAAEEGCSVCKMIAHQLPSHIMALGDSGLSVPDPISWTLRWYGGEESIDQQKKGYIDYGGIIIKSSYFVSCFRLLGTRSSNAPITTLRPDAGLTDQAVLETARSWLQNCRQNHALCGSFNPTFNPTRLIYIHDASSVQLIETKKEAKTHPYVAFSHCWGTSKHLTLLQDDPETQTKGNYEELLLSPIQVQNLPTSYQEGITVSLALGFRHIWIDSLCIIQNNYDDWAKESATMKDVYASCSLNLCATAAADSSEASFQSRGSSMIAPLDIEPQWTGILDGEYQEGKLRPLPSYLRNIKFKLVSGSMYSSEIHDAPLNKRAWVIQERYLSKRHLFMTCNQLWWECYEIIACEVLPAGVPSSFVFWVLQPNEHERTLFFTFSIRDTESTRDQLAQSSYLDGQTNEDMYTLWKELVQRYTRCNLTIPSDKLPALSGLAQTFSIVQGLEFALEGNSYLAGLWRPFLPRALCWAVETSSPTYPCHQYRAPSWSWASGEGAVHYLFQDPHAEMTCSVVDVNMVYEDERYKAGAVKGGVLHLRSHLIEVFPPFNRDRKYAETWATFSPHIDGRVTEITKYAHLFWDLHDLKSQRSSISYFDQLSHTVHKDGIIKGTGAVRKEVFLDPLIEELRVRVFLVPLTVDSWSTLGLILCQVVSNPELEDFDGDAVFQRVGSFMVWRIEKEELDLIPERTIAII